MHTYHTRHPHIICSHLNTRQHNISRQCPFTFNLHIDAANMGLCAFRCFPCVMLAPLSAVSHANKISTIMSKKLFNIHWEDWYVTSSVNKSPPSSAIFRPLVCMKSLILLRVCIKRKTYEYNDEAILGCFLLNIRMHIGCCRACCFKQLRTFGIRVKRSILRSHNSVSFSCNTCCHLVQ